MATEVYRFDATPVPQAPANPSTRKKYRRQEEQRTPDATHHE